MKNSILLAIAIVGLFLASCTSVNRSMREPNTVLELYADDFDLSSQVSASAKSTRIFGLDFERLFKQETGSVVGGAIALSPTALIASVPVIGSFVNDPTAQYALYNLMEANAGYDVIMYPSYKTTIQKPLLGLPIFTISTVEVTAKLGKMK